MACSVTWDHDVIGSGLLQRAVSGSEAIQWVGSELMSGAPVVTKGHANHASLVSHLGTCLCLQTMPHLGPCRSGWLMLLPRAIENVAASDLAPCLGP